MVLKSDEVNYLVYRYLKESGFLHSSYAFQFESQISKLDQEIPNVEPGLLIQVLQKGLQYMDVETHLNEDGTARTCSAPFSILGKHVCSAQTDKGKNKQHTQDDSKAAHGGHTLVHEASKRLKARDANHDDESDEMDVDVPDTEKESRKPSYAEPGKGRKARIIERVQMLRGHGSPVFLCTWNPVTANVLATGAGDGTARIWDLSKGKSDPAYMAVLKHDALANGSPVDVTALVWNPQGSLLATASFAGQLCVWAGSGEPKHAFAPRAVPIIALRWNKKGNYLLSAYLDGIALDIDWNDNTTFASCSADKSILVWRVGESAPIRSFVGHTGDVNSIKWHPGGKYLASSSDDGTVKVWSMASDTPVHDFVGHAQQVYAVKWLPRVDKAIVASASFDGTVRPVHCFTFSADGRYLASGSFDKKVRVWSIKDGTLFKTFAAEDGIHDVQWASKGKIAAAIANNVVAVFDPML
ncbi:WD40 repeat-like protein [Linderina pennispora]|uniref:WD40 repeat-like protein n=1 Tax=Linderina pennispora TaxID=61395 RepID=A0A1Y1VXI0_9FUNG|nr:WD40 repeat-like protein [Linderina pennispora]ORX66011.1 WD40 repeat-like protein [Linderina pennispora]